MINCRLKKEKNSNMSSRVSEAVNLVVCGSSASLKSSVSELILQQMNMDLYTRLIHLQDLPTLVQLSEQEVMRASLRCVSLCHPGVHLFLLIISGTPINNEDRAEMEAIQRIFSSRINRHMMVLIMQSSEHQTAELNEETQAVLQSFGGRHHFIGPNTYVSTLMEKIEETLEENRGDVYSTETFLETQMEKLMKYEEMKKKIDSMETHLQPRASREETDELRIVLLGKTGVGKSATGNTILGRVVFTAETSQESVTRESQSESSDLNNRRVNVIDTPGLFDTELSDEEIRREISHCISMILPGPHVFIIVLSLGQRFTKHEEESVKILQETFGDKSVMFTMVLFTRGDDLKDKTLEQCLGKPGSAIRKLTEACGNRVHVFNNNQTGDPTQVYELLEKIDNMVEENGGSFYSCKMFREMERERQERWMKILMDRVREREEEMKKHEEERERMKRRMEEERQNQDEQRKRREEEFNKREDQYKSLMKEKEELMKKLKEKNDEQRKRREKDFREKEERYKRLIKEKEEKENEMLEEMKQGRMRWEKLKSDLHKRQQSAVTDQTAVQKRRVPVSTEDRPVFRRIVLLGKSGVGKTASGHTILGWCKLRPTIFDCSEAQATVSGRSLSVVDTPGFNQSRMSNEKIMRKIKRHVYSSSPGAHAFLIVLHVGRYTDQEQQITQMIEKMFGQEVLKYSVILFTHGDWLEDQSVEEIIDEHETLSDLVYQCGGGFQVFNNKDMDNRDRVNELLQKIDSMIEQNGGGHFSHEMNKRRTRAVYPFCF